MVAYVTCPSKTSIEKYEKNLSTTKESDLFSMVGTIFLWM